MRYFQFLFRHRGCASGSAFTCSHELPPSAGPVLTYLGTVPYLPLQTLAIAFEAWTSREKPSSHKRLRYQVVTPSICYPITTYEREFLTVDRINYPEHHSR